MFGHAWFDLDFVCSESKVNQKMTVKEHFVYTDSEGTLYHFVVEGTGFADASRVPAEVSVISFVDSSWQSAGVTETGS